MIKKVITYPLAAIFYLAFATASSASDKGFYTGVNIGNYTIEEQEVESSQTGIGFFAGYSFNQYLEIDASLFDAGSHDDLGLEATGMSLSIRGKYSINDHWQIFGEVGGLFLDQQIDEAMTTVDDEGMPTLSDGRDTGSLFGFGIKYKVNHWDVVGKVSQADTDADFSILSLGIAYRF